jgi:hypothetical protein
MMQNAAFAATINTAPLKKSFSAVAEGPIMLSDQNLKNTLEMTKKKPAPGSSPTAGFKYEVNLRYIISDPAIEALERFQNSRLAMAFAATALVITVL